MLMWLIPFNPSVSKGSNGNPPPIVRQPHNERGVTPQMITIPFYLKLLCWATQRTPGISRVFLGFPTV